MIEELTDNAKIVLEKRYLQRNESGELIEDAEGMFQRVANTLASVEKRDGMVSAYADEFYKIMSSMDFLPNSPTLMNAGTGAGTLSACFVLPIEDSMEGITDAGKNAALVQKFGGGTGFSLSDLRPKGSPIKTTHGKACGPISVLKYLSAVSTMVTQGGKRDGANMAVMNVHHPDIMEFITCKQVEGDIHNFNISVGVTNKFMEAVLSEKEYELKFPIEDGEVVDNIPASHVFNAIVENAWSNGEPGVVFLDEINRNSPVRHIGEITATNPCAEQPLLPYESCNLGSINLSNFILDQADGKCWIDWDRLEETVRIAVRMLDNVIDANEYAIPEIKYKTYDTRKIGLGVMGFADLLVKLGIPYESDKALYVADVIISSIKKAAEEESERLATIKGKYPSSIGTGDKKRNSCVLTVAPTGTISMIAECSSGIEPLFSLVYRKHNVLDGETLYYVNEEFEKLARKHGFYSNGLISHLEKGGSLQDRDEVPENYRKLFQVSADISPKYHVKMQSVFQRHIDSGVSKTINLPNSANIEDVKQAYIQAWETKCKGITVYRAGSRENEVLTKGHNESTDAVSKRERPGVLSGQTSRIRTGRGNVYVTVNVDDSGKPFEVFATHGKAGGNDSAMAEAVSRLVSLSLRSGVPVNDIIIQLRGITDTPAWDNGVLVRSVPDALAMVLVNSNSVEDVLSVDDLCPECSSDAVAFEEGCFKCYECSYSRC